MSFFDWQNVKEYYKVINDEIVNICIDSDINVKDINPQEWNYILLSINENIFMMDKSILRDYNRANIIALEYNRLKVFTCLYIYKKLCNYYKQIISIDGFSKFTGINKATFASWEKTNDYIYIYNNINYDLINILGLEIKEITKNNNTNIETNTNNNVIYKLKLKYSSIKISQNLRDEKELSLQDKMYDRKNNPTPYIATLNHQYNWINPIQETIEEDKNNVSLEEIASTLENISLLEDKKQAEE